MTKRYQKNIECVGKEMSQSHLIAERKKLAQKEYKQGHDNITRIVHFYLCQKFGSVGEVKLYYHKLACVVENGRVKILWDLNIQTDHIIQYRKPDIVVLYKTERKCHLIDIAVPWDKTTEFKEQEKVDNYSEPRRKVKKIWNLTQFMVVPVVIGSLSSDIKKIERLTEEVRCKK